MPIIHTTLWSHLWTESRLAGMCLLPDDVEIDEFTYVIEAFELGKTAQISLGLLPHRNLNLNHT